MQHSRNVPFRLLSSGHNQEMMPSSAAAVEFAGPRQVRVAAVALPEPGPDEVVVTTHFSGISGGRELLAYRGEIDPGVPLDDRIESLDATFTYPFRYGYASTEQSGVAEGCRGDVEDPNARLPSDPRMSRAAQRRLPLPLLPCRTGG
jgi:hypothetical protein